MDNTKIITIGTLKGGTGKTTTVFNIGGILSENHKVLLIDVDPQSNLTSNMGASLSRKERSVRLIFQKLQDSKGNKVMISPSAIVKKGLIPELPNLDLIPSHIDLTKTETQLVERPNREMILSNYMRKNAEFFSQYDYILIDTNPSMGIINTNAFLVADEIILVSDVSENSIQGCNLCMQMWAEVMEDMERDSRINTMIINNVDVRTREAVRISDLANTDPAFSGIYVCKHQLPDAVRIKETSSEQRPINVLGGLASQKGNKNSIAVAETAFRDIITELYDRGVL